MRIMGTMLISSLIIFPALTSMRVFNSFKSVIISSGIISVACFFIGMTVSFLYSTPAGASVVLVNAVAFLIFSVIGMVTKRI
ncbi:MAG TPA: metal ABC transporter permease [Erysipelothrix sp.]|nr:metal ABC transporter permease [Erysipelothrix sp.]